VVQALEPGLAVTVVDATWFANMSDELAVVTRCWVNFKVTDPIPIWAHLVAHAAVRDGFTSATGDVTGEAGGTFAVGSAGLVWTDSIVAYPLAIGQTHKGREKYKHPCLAQHSLVEVNQAIKAWSF